MKYPALDVTGVDSELLESLVVDYSPTAVEHDLPRSTYFFSDPLHRARAKDAIAHAWPDAVVETREVDDEDWARRSQQNLQPITVGRITVTPPWGVSPSGSPSPDRGTNPGRSHLTLVIAPSMGFGTGHHATTRLCLAALQTLDLENRTLLDVGTGSGVLALAGRALGARQSMGIDFDADAIEAARENLDTNPGLRDVRLVVGDLRDTTLPRADVVTANLTGALLVQTASRLASLVAPGGTLVVSGLLAHERDEVVAALSAAATPCWEATEDGWVGLAFNFPTGSAV